MFKVMVADDEKLIRDGLAETIPWKELGLELVGTAEDGLKAIKLIKEIKPDIVLTDIRMPFIDGLSLISEVHRIVPNCRVIIITGFGEFEYAKTAIQLGVSDYILKPVNIPELCGTLSHIVGDLNQIGEQKAEIEKIRTRMQQTDEFRLQRLLLYYMQGRMPLQQFLSGLTGDFSDNCNYMLILLQIDEFDNLTADMDEESIFNMMQKFENSLFSVREELNKIVIEESSGRYLILFRGNCNEDLLFLVRAYIRHLRLVRSDFRFTTVSSELFREIGKSQAAYQFVNKSLDYSFRIGSNRDITPPDINETPGSSHWSDIPSMDGLIKAISNFNKREIYETFKDMSDEIRDSGKNSYLYTRMISSMIYGEIIRMTAEIHCPIESIIEDPEKEYKKILSATTLDSMFQELYHFIEKICDFVDDKMTLSKNVVGKAKLYIEANYADSQLTLDKVAGAIGITPNYFSALFKQYTAQSFINYLTEIRLKNACSLLKGGNYKTYEVAFKCGYDNATYFSTIFKKYIGISPSEYCKTKQRT